MNEFKDIEETAERALSERHIENLRQSGGIFVEAVRLTRMPMLVTDATLPGNPITFANEAFVKLSGYAMDELLGQDPHFMNGEGTDPDAIRQYEGAIREGWNASLEIQQYRKDGTAFWAMLFASPLDDGQGRVTGHFLSFLDITRRREAEHGLRELSDDLERRVAARTQELEAANIKLAELVAERDMLMVEVNHRAKNSLAVAASLLHIQARRQSDPSVKMLFNEAEDHLGAMARVHDLLSRSESAQRIDLAVYIAELCDALTSLTAGHSRIRLSAEAEAGILINPDAAFPLGIVATELVTNAVKYAFPAPGSGTILVKVRRAPSGHVELLVQDDGIGMTSPREGSLGYGLVHSLVRQLGGEIEIKSGNGLAVTISFAP